ncbi:MAG: FKBP-type peptidyl-prolyl cis-trans isomerase [Acidobacteriota bacterium]
MKSIPVLAVVCLAAFVACGAESTATAAQGEDSGLETFEQRLSYIVGANLGKQLAADGIEVDLDVVLQGLKDTLSGGEMKIGQDQIQATMQELQSKMQEKMTAAAQTNLEAGQAFLAENGTKEGVVTLDNGLQYRIISEGTGAKPAATDRVTVHYTGTLIDGTKFDSSRDRGMPTTFGLNQVIAGWTQALQLMSVGSQWEVFIPAELGYGMQPPPGSPIGPNSALVFDVELIGIE